MDSTQLRELISQTPWVVERFRQLMYPGAPAVTDEPTGSISFGPKSPCNDFMLDMADVEAAGLGTLARYCIAMGTIPAQPLKGFWWVNGECKGLKGEVDAIMPTVFLLKAYVPEILDTEGVEDIVNAMQVARAYSLTMFPEEHYEWVTMKEAINFTGRGQSTIYRWISAGAVRTIDNGWGLLICAGDLLRQMELIKANKSRNTLDLVE